jgi:YfiH family protein
LSNLHANWNAPSHIRALTTTRNMGSSPPPYDYNNLGLHVGDNEQSVLANRTALIKALSLSQEPIWLEQTHTNDCVIVEEETNRIADAAITRKKSQPLVIMTADCLPIVLCNQAGTEIAAIHAGWRGLVNGIVENTLAKMHSNPKDLLAWVGPAICQRCYETGSEVQQAYASKYPYTASSFEQHGSKFHANLPKMAELILNAQGVMAVFQSAACTFELKHEFYSYRREAQTGRMATLIWIQDN